MLEQSWNTTWNAAGDDINAKYPKWNDFFGAVLDGITPEVFAASGLSNQDDPDAWGGWLGDRTKVFHPQLAWHSSIMSSILKQYRKLSILPISTSKVPR